MSALRSFVPRASASRYLAFSSASGMNAQRSFQSCRMLGVGKESALHDEDRANKAEAHKQDQLLKQKEGKGHWKDELASDSESIIKADRDEINPKQTIEELQKESAKVANSGEFKARFEKEVRVEKK